MGRKNDGWEITTASRPCIEQGVRGDDVARQHAADAGKLRQHVVMEAEERCRIASGRVAPDTVGKRIAPASRSAAARVSMSIVAGVPGGGCRLCNRSVRIAAMAAIATRTIRMICASRFTREPRASYLRAQQQPRGRLEPCEFTWR